MQCLAQLTWSAICSHSGNRAAQCHSLAKASRRRVARDALATGRRPNRALRYRHARPRNGCLQRQGTTCRRARHLDVGPDLIGTDVVDVGSDPIGSDIDHIGSDPIGSESLTL